jgi:small conductance mechanosensitive channel
LIDILNFLKQAFVQRTIWVVFLVAVSLLVTKIILKIYDKFSKRSRLDPLVGKILRIALKILLLFLSVIIVLASLGISVSAFVATLSVVGVAFSLAVQGFLSNVFGGIQIITNKPFKIGDYVEAGGESGTVREVGLFYTKLDTPDKKLIQIPNSQIANEHIINYSSAVNRRVEFTVGVSYDEDVEKVKSVLLSLMTAHPAVLQEEGMMPVVHVKEYRDNDVCYTARAWCAGSDYWTVYFDVMDAIKPTFEEKGIAFSYPHMNVHMMTK